MLNIAFMSNQLGERGTEVALYDYAHYNETILDNNSIIIYYNNNCFNSPKAVEKFKSRFDVFGITQKEEVDCILEKNNVHIFYYIHSGGVKDGILSKVAKNCVHAVFTCEKHGDAYASISKYVPGDHNIDVIPHMVSLPNSMNNMREELNIPRDALVISGYGGRDSFNIKYVQNTVYEIAKNNPNIYFVFANFDRFTPKIKNIIYLEKIIDLNKKVEFINTSDAMIWARSIGETFGLAIAEFSSKNKPVIAAKVGWCQAHVEYLGDKGLWYHDSESLKKIILGLNRDEIIQKDWNAYKELTPDKVMYKFKKIFIDPFH
jgi:hypothetical protein